MFELTISLDFLFKVIIFAYFGLKVALKHFMSIVIIIANFTFKVDLK